MSSEEKPVVAIVSLQVQTSFQAVPLGAACVVSSLRTDASLRGKAAVSFADFSLEDDFLAGLSPSHAGKAIAARLAADRPSIAGFSVFVWNRAVLEAASLELKRLVPEIVTFAGGPEVTADPGSFSTLPSGSPERAFDYLVPGEGESLSVSLVASILSGAPVPASVSSPVRAPSEDCARLASPWLDGTLSACRSVTACRGALWELARGCPYKCSYCYESRGDKKVRTFPLDRLGRELDYFVASGIERVFVLDPTYNASRERAIAILGLIRKKAGELHFNFEVRAEHLDREMIQAFSKIPCSLQIGLQSSNEEALRLVSRPCNLREFTKKIGLLNEAGIVFGLDLMYGLPGDTLTSFRASIDFAVGLYPNNLEIFRLAVLPGTDLHEHAGELGLKHEKSPPYLVESTPKFPAQDIGRAASLAFSCDIFYTQGRAVTWFLSVLHPLKLKPSQFFQDFAAFLDSGAGRSLCPALPASGGKSLSCEIPHRDAERLQLAFVEKKYLEKGKAFLVPVIKDIIRLNGALTRSLAESEETVLSLSYDPDDLLSPDAMDVESFCENAYMENCRIRVFPGADGPDIETLG